MKTGKIGCFFVYSIFLIILGMGLYKYRVEVMDYLTKQYHALLSKAQDKAEEVKSDVTEAKY